MMRARWLAGRSFRALPAPLVMVATMIGLWPVGENLVHYLPGDCQGEVSGGEMAGVLQCVFGSYTASQRSKPISQAGRLAADLDADV